MHLKADFLCLFRSGFIICQAEYIICQAEFISASLNKFILVVWSESFGLFRPSMFPLSATIPSPKRSGIPLLSGLF